MPILSETDFSKLDGYCLREWIAVDIYLQHFDPDTYQFTFRTKPAALASGALLAAMPADLAESTCRTLSEEGFQAAIIGHAIEGAGVRFADGRELPRYERDEVLRLFSGPAKQD